MSDETEPRTGTEPATADREIEMVDSPAFDPQSVEVAQGETKELTWNFTESGGLLIGCQIPGHFEAGMVSDVTVT